MGMLSHAVITRDDGKVFIHLHPMGTINMGRPGELRKEGRDRWGVDGRDARDDPSRVEHPLLPYEFPQPGRYRLWVQVKNGGQVRTGVFDAMVGKVKGANQ